MYDDAERKCPCEDRPAPTKFFQKSNEKDRKGVPNTIGESKCDETDAYDNPTLVKGIFVSHGRDDNLFKRKI
jgi:hypothetical protein